MAKPATLDGYIDQYTLDCERLLLTLLRGLGPWKESVYLVGGLTPRYLVRQRPPAVPAHAGTQDVDLVIDLQILADTEAYVTLEGSCAASCRRRETRSGRSDCVRWRWRSASRPCIAKAYPGRSLASGSVSPGSASSNCLTSV